MYIIYNYIYIYICVCVFAIQVPHISPHCIATCPILVVFWTAKNQDDVVRQAIIPLSAPHQSDAGAVETAFFFWFWMLESVVILWDSEPYNRKTFDTQIYDAMMLY